MTLGFTRSDFPDGFVWGAATSAYQIEGHAHGGAGPTHWDSFAATPGNVLRGEDGARACDHYHRWEEDLDLVRDLGVDAYRFSTSWARVLPEGLGAPNAEGLDFYDRLVDGMLARGIKPAATLYHWELPQALSDRGGWASPDMADWFEHLTRTVMDRIGDRVWSVAPINEPWCVSWLSHFIGAHAPGRRDVRAAVRAVHNVLRSHARATAVMRDMGMGNLGAVCNFEATLPADGGEQSARAAARQDAIYNRAFIEPMTRGTYPGLYLEGAEAHLPANWQDDMEAIRAPLDWFGVNYYTRSLVSADAGPWPHGHSSPGPLPTTAMGWEIYPEGLRATLNLVKDHVGDLPVHVTENGCASYDEIRGGAVRDEMRLDYLRGHIAAARQAMEDGVNLQGYFVWSLMDNYEWALGYEKRFGLVHVDFETLKRTPKASYHALAASLAR